MIEWAYNVRMMDIDEKIVALAWSQNAYELLSFDPLAQKEWINLSNELKPKSVG